MTNVKSGLPSRGGHGHPSLSGSLVHQASVTLDHDAIVALPTTWVELAGAPGATRINLFIQAVVVSDLVQLYTLGAVTEVGVFYGDQFLNQASGIFVNGDVQHGLTALLANAGTKQQLWTLGPNIGYDLSDDQWGAVFSNPGASGLDYVNLLNQPLKFGAGSGDNFGGGDPDNRIVCAAEFRVFDLATGLFLTTAESGWNADTRLFA